MIKTIITQRLTSIDSYIEYRDSLDIRFYNFLKQIKILPFPIPNFKNLKDAKQFLLTIKPTLIILSGGENLGKYKSRDKLEMFLINYAIKNKIKLIGICRGMQSINKFYGGTLKKVDKHVAKHHYLKIISNEIKIPSRVNSFHKLSIDKLGKNLTIIARSKNDNQIEAIISNNLNIFGIMWHPERNKNYNSNLLMIKSFIINNK